MAADEPERFVVVDAGVGVADVATQTFGWRSAGCLAWPPIAIGAAGDASPMNRKPPALRMTR